jgi:hypothetical protein
MNLRPHIANDRKLAQSMRGARPFACRGYEGRDTIG